MSRNDTFTKTLNIWYLKNKRDLPWRKTRDPYIIWLSEIILQQTKVSQGTTYFLKISKKYSDVNSLARASEEEVLKLWQGLGYYSRARNMHKTAIHISEKCKGVFPNNYIELIKLNGVGDYTASAIASICFNEASATVDGNVFRFLSRQFGIYTPINSTVGFKEFKSLAQILLDKNNPGNHNQALMEFGALICTPKNPKCNECPFSKSCHGINNQVVEELPQKTNKIKIKKRHFNYLVLRTESNRTVIRQRNGNDIWKNLYEFPLIESKSEIDFKDLIADDTFQLLLANKAYHISKYNPKPLRHKLTHQHLYCTFWIIDTILDNNRSIAWENLNKFAVPTLMQNFIDNYKKSDYFL
jgi:A/G-specific adenine glycosylase